MHKLIKLNNKYYKSKNSNNPTPSKNTESKIQNYRKLINSIIEYNSKKDYWKKK